MRKNEKNKNVFTVAIDPEKKEAFLNDWFLVGEPLRKACSIHLAQETPATSTAKILATIRVENHKAVASFKDGVFGSRGFLTARGWSATQC